MFFLVHFQCHTFPRKSKCGLRRLDLRAPAPVISNTAGRDLQNLVILSTKIRRILDSHKNDRSHRCPADNKYSSGSRISLRGAPTSWGGANSTRRLCFEKFVCQNERIWTRGGGGGWWGAGGAPLGSATEIICSS